MSAGSELSVVVITPGSFDLVRKTIGHLREEPARGRVELILVAPDRDRLGELGDALDGFGSSRIVETGEMTTTGKAMERGFAVASAPLITYVEEHAYVEPGWVEAMIEAHRGPWAGVGSSLLNANPDSAVSWAMLMLDFGPFVELSDPAEVTALPSHQTAYKRAAVEGHREPLHRLLEVETVLCEKLLARGDRLYVESRARRRHLNATRVRSMLRGQYYGGRQYAPLRGFSVARRLAYAVAAPLISVVQLRRILRHLPRASVSRGMRLRILPPLVLGLVAEQAGETVGYLRGRQGDAPEKRLSLELNRADHIG